MSAGILSIGTELTRGELVNTNATWLADQLTSVGFTVESIETVADVRGHVVDSLRRLAARHRVVVITGGLGPTTDDLTAECAAEAAHTELVRHEPSVEAIRRRFVAIGREMTASNLKQADLPATADVLPNPVGTAPGFTLALGGARLFFTPGVPTEMKRMFEEQILPRIAQQAPSDTAQNHLLTFGQTESRVGELLGGVEEAFPGVTLGYRAHFPQIEVKVFARGKSKAEAQTLADAAAAEVRHRLGDIVFGESRDDSFGAAVGRALRAKGLTLAVAESCTGGLVGHLLTVVPGSSDYLLLDAVTYANAAKTAVLGVDPELIRGHGAVSAECAQAMAEGVRRLVDADIGLSITGIAGPTGGSDHKPVGLVYLGIATRSGPSVVKERKLSGDRGRIQTMAAYLSLKLALDFARSTGETSGREG